MQQIIIDFGTLNFFGLALPLRVYGYGLMLVCGFVAGIYLAMWRAKRLGESGEHISYCCLLALIGGIVGSRAAYVIQHWRTQFAGEPNPLAAIGNISSGGLIYYGGVAVAMVAVLGYLRLKRLPIRRYLDILSVSLLVALAFGRAGCLLNGCCYGAQCRATWPLGMRFAMYSRPLVKLDGRDNPYSVNTDAPTPAYAHQFALGRVSPDERLINIDGAARMVHPPRELHGKLAGDQLAVMLADRQIVRRKFDLLAGPNGRLSYDEWGGGLRSPGGLLGGSEHWDEAICYDVNRDGQLSFDELRAYFNARAQRIKRRFAADGDGELTAPQRSSANAYLQADLFEIVADSWSGPVKPAQLLGIANALFLAGLLSVFFRLRSREGQVFALMLILYPITRFVLEAIRDDNPHDISSGILTHNQYTSLASVGIGVIIWLVILKLPASADSRRRRRNVNEQPDRARS